MREEIEIGADDRRVLIYPYDGSLSGSAGRASRYRRRLCHRQPGLSGRSTMRRSCGFIMSVPGNPYLSNLLRLFPNVELTGARAGNLAASGKILTMS